MSLKTRNLKFSSLATKLSVILKKREEYNEVLETQFQKQIATPKSDFEFDDREEGKPGSIYSMKHIPILDTISYSINTMTPQIRKIEEIDKKMMESSFTMLSKNSSAKSSLVMEKREKPNYLGKMNYLQRLCYNGSQNN